MDLAHSAATPVPGRARRPADDPLGSSPVPRGRATALQTVLPFDDEADLPIAYALTPAARRSVGAVPAARLRVVRAPGDHVRGATGLAGSDPHDIRPARARAMRRAGHDLEVIALRLSVALEDVASWTVGIVPAGAARMGRRGPRRTSRFEGDAGALATPPVVDARTRRSAAREAAGRLAADAVLARDLGLIAGGARPIGGTVTIALPDLGLVSAVLDRLRSDADLAPHGVRIVVRVGPARPADRVRHEWAERLDLPLDRVAAVRWPLASDPSDVEATVHLVSPGVVARVLGWIDAIGAQVGRRDLRETS